MFKFFAIFASLVSASAFAPSSMKAGSSGLQMAFKNEIGAQAPLGFFDPLGLLKVSREFEAITIHPSSPITNISS